MQCVFGVHRSGTTLVTANLEGTNFHEYFAEDKVGFEDTGEGIKIVKHFGQTQQDHFELLQKYQHLDYNVKFLPSQVPDYIFNWLNKNTKIICVERRNKLDQFISYVIASRLNCWRGLTFKAPENSIFITEEEIHKFNSFYNEYHNRKKRINNKTILTYEDLLLNKVNKNKYNLVNRLDYIQNKESVISFIKFLNDIY